MVSIHDLEDLESSYKTNGAETFVLDRIHLYRRR
jgi:hypothetical protein